MIVCRIDLAAEKWELARLAAAIFQPTLLIVLAGGLVLASAHMLTMLGTRWGRRRVSQKALVFSIVVHLSLISGMLALWPEALPAGSAMLRWRPAPAPEPPPEAFNVITEFNAEPSPAVLAASPAAPRPVWDQVTDTFTPSPERTQPEAVPLDQPPPDVRPATDTPSPTDIAVATPLPEPERQQPELTEIGELSPVVELPATVAMPAPTGAEAGAAAAAAETTAPSVERVRLDRTPDSIANLSDPGAIQRPEAAPVERLTPEPNLDPARSVAGDFDEQAALKSVDEGLEIVRPEGPIPAEIPTPGADAALLPATTANAETPLRPSMSRTRVAAPGSSSVKPAVPTDVERVRPTIPDVAPGRSDAPPASSDSIARSEVPSIERPELGLPPAGARTAVPAPYRLRGAEERAAATRRFGGNAESERAVELSLQWLARVQTADGFWDASEFGAGSTREEGIGDQKQTFNNVGRDADTGLTGLAVLAFLGRGHTLEQGQYRENVQRAVRWLVSVQRARDGGMGGGAGKTDYSYCHAMATFALAEAYANSDKASSEWLRLPVQRAVQHTLDTMTPDGGWRYEKGQADGDMSIFGWQLMALKQAELGGITFPKVARDRMVRFLIARSLGANGGLAGYRSGDRPSPSMTAEALYCKQQLGISRENPACAEAVAFLQRSLPQRTQLNYYYWYYGSLAMRQYGGDSWTQWNDQLRDLLIQEQVSSGEFAGSWDPNDPWGRYGGRIYSTALATLCLEVYYRYGEQE